MARKTPKWFNGTRYDWDDRRCDYVREVRKDGKRLYIKLNDDRLRFFDAAKQALILPFSKPNDAVVRYAGTAKGYGGYGGQTQGAKGVTGASGAGKPSIWYRGYEYEWNEESNEYLRWVRQGNGPAKPFTLKEAVGNDLKKYEKLLKKSPLKKATATKKQPVQKPTKVPEPPKFDFTKLAYKGFTASDKDLKKFKASLKKLDEKELEEAKKEITQYVVDFRHGLSYFDEKHKEAGVFGQTFLQAVQDELDSRKPQNKIEYPTFDFEGCKSIDEYKKYLASLKSDGDVANQKKKIALWSFNANTDWAMKYGMKLSLSEYKKSVAKCQQIVGDIASELLKAVGAESRGRREEAARRRNEELERRKAAKKDATAKNKVEAYRPDVSQFPENVSATRELNVALGGSTGAKMVEDEHGNRYIRKEGASQAHVRNEGYADAFYQAAGVKVPGFKIYEDGDKTIKLATVIKNAKSLGEWWNDANDDERKEMRKKLRQGYAADVLLGNWDVVGLDADNILIDKDGEAWRIDNGGSMGFRAQGAKKNSASWGNYIDDLFTMTGHGEVVGRSATSTITKYFGDVRPLELAQEIDSLDWSDALKTLPDDERSVVENRLEEIRQIAERGTENEKFGRTKESTDEVIAFSYQLCRDGLREALPKGVNLNARNLGDWETEAGWFKHGNETKTLNNEDYGSFGEYLAKKMGKENFNFIREANESQGFDSYNEDAINRKFGVLKAQGFDCADPKYKTAEDFLKDIESAGIYCGYSQSSVSSTSQNHRQRYEDAFNNFKKNPDKLEQIFRAVNQYDAAVQLVLENVQLENVDPVTRTCVLGRTAKTKYLQGSDGKAPKDGEESICATGPCESHSRVQLVCAQHDGSEMGSTLVTVPFSRIHGLWIIERGIINDFGKYVPEGVGQFMDNSENEIIADTHGLPIIYVGSIKEYEPIEIATRLKILEEWNNKHPENRITGV